MRALAAELQSASLHIALGRSFGNGPSRSCRAGESNLIDVHMLCKRLACYVSESVEQVEASFGVTLNTVDELSNSKCRQRCIFCRLKQNAAA